MSTENLYQVSKEIRKNDFFVEESKIYNDFYKVIFIDSPIENLPLSVPHGIENIKLGFNEYNVIINLLIDDSKRLHMAFQNISVKVDENNLTIFTDEKGEKISGKIILNYKKEGAFETIRMVRPVQRTEEQNFPQGS